MKDETLPHRIHPSQSMNDFDAEPGHVQKQGELRSKEARPEFSQTADGSHHHVVGSILEQLGRLCSLLQRTDPPQSLQRQHPDGGIRMAKAQREKSPRVGKTPSNQHGPSCTRQDPRLLLSHLPQKRFRLHQAHPARRLNGTGSNGKIPLPDASEERLHHRPIGHGLDIGL